MKDWQNIECSDLFCKIIISIFFVFIFAAYMLVLLQLNPYCETSAYLRVISTGIYNGFLRSQIENLWHNKNLVRCWIKYVDF